MKIIHLLKGIIGLTADFLPARTGVRRKWNHIFKELRENNFWPRILYQVKLSFKNEGKIKTNVQTNKEWEILHKGSHKIRGN